MITSNSELPGKLSELIERKSIDSHSSRLTTRPPRPLPALVIVSWSRVHQPSSPSSSWNVPVGPSVPIVAIRTMFRALTSTGLPPEFCTPPSSVAV